MNEKQLSTYYVPEGETRTLEVVGVSIGDGADKPLTFVDGTALFLLCRVAEAKTDEPLLLKQFGASQLLLAGLHPTTLEPGQVVEVSRFEGGGYEVETDSLDDLSDAM